MTQDAAAGVVLPIWRSWTAKFMFQRALFKEQVADLGGKRMRAEKRAAAAEFIAQEANTVRLKALLDAAREQAEVETIRSAERRFADAKTDWESAQNVFREPAGDRPGDGVDDPLPAAGHGQAARTLPGRFAALMALAVGGAPSRRAILSFAGVAAIVAAAVFLYTNINGMERGDSRIVDTVMPRPGAPSETVASTLNGIDPAIPGDGELAVPMMGGEFPAAMESAERAGSDVLTTAPKAAAVTAVQVPQAPAKNVIRKRRHPPLKMAPTPARNPYRAVPATTAISSDQLINDGVE